MYSKTSHQSKCIIIKLNIFPNDKNNLILFIKLLILKIIRDYSTPLLIIRVRFLFSRYDL